MQVFTDQMPFWPQNLQYWREFIALITTKEKSGHGLIMFWSIQQLISDGTDVTPFKPAFLWHSCFPQTLTKLNKNFYFFSLNTVYTIHWQPKRKQLPLCLTTFFFFLGLGRGGSSCGSAASSHVSNDSVLSASTSFSSPVHCSNN